MPHETGATDWVRESGKGTPHETGATDRIRESGKGRWCAGGIGASHSAD